MGRTSVSLVDSDVGEWGLNYVLTDAVRPVCVCVPVSRCIILHSETAGSQIRVVLCFQKRAVVAAHLPTLI